MGFWMVMMAPIPRAEGSPRGGGARHSSMNNLHGPHFSALHHVPMDSFAFLGKTEYKQDNLSGIWAQDGTY